MLRRLSIIVTITALAMLLFTVDLQASDVAVNYSIECELQSGDSPWRVLSILTLVNQNTEMIYDQSIVLAYRNDKPKFVNLRKSLEDESNGYDNSGTTENILTGTLTFLVSDKKQKQTAMFYPQLGDEELTTRLRFENGTLRQEVLKGVKFDFNGVIVEVEEELESQWDCNRHIPDYSRDLILQAEGIVQNN